MYPPTLAEHGMLGMTAHTAAKAAFQRNSDLYYQEVLDQFTSTSPAKRIGTPEDVANLIVYLGSEANIFVKQFV
ncbi:hypothetical protein SAMN05444392_1125 [Seinonella peptonophila]|uniref:Enoyl-(Acyl carrier protein) reductase n=1 Tax=Seinonella peptonophila TaxID=112248 RepID=A0A1M5A568_9BACL|nr:hypothetical protein [Seinonella peptonophila]SHF25116.1 hypothetical protein SAMN05444392_1125 [Seinonella peptonophila]